MLHKEEMQVSLKIQEQFVAFAIPRLLRPIKECDSEKFSCERWFTCLVSVGAFLI